jgi:ABC-type transporter Mla subunit MlaD
MFFAILFAAILVVFFVYIWMRMDEEKLRLTAEMARWRSSEFSALTLDERDAYFLMREDGQLARVDTPPILEERQHELPARTLVASLLPIGLLGTFLGITQGLLSLRGLDLSAIGSDAQQLQQLVQGVGALLDGMGTAFGSTIVAIILYLLSLRMHESCLKQIEQQRVEVLSDLARVAPLFSPLKVLAQLDTEVFQRAAESLAATATSLASSATVLKQSSVAFGEAAGSLGDNARALSDAARSLSSEAIGNAVGAETRKAMRELLKPSFDSMAKSLSVVPQLSDSIVRLETQLIPSIQKSIDASVASSSSIERTVGESHAAMSRLGEKITTLSHASERLVTAVRDDLGAASASLRAAMTDFQGTTMAAMQRFRDEWEGAMTHSLGSLQRVAQQLDSLEGEYQRARVHMEHAMAVYEGKAGAIDASIERAIELVEQSGEVVRTFQAFTEELHEVFDSLETKTVGLHTRFFDEAGEAIVELVEQMEGVVSAAREYEVHRGRSPRSPQTPDAP